MKNKTTKPSALKVFNDNKVTANKKADVTMKSFKKSLPKATKFAALAPPYNKATFADRIVGAKKNKKK